MHICQPMKRRTGCCHFSARKLISRGLWRSYFMDS
uniref:MAP3K epsilon protein kinase 1-like isoform X2 n=1 Tax=Rhizophora mucronata TaxID=61149 RepID=A0A2P2JHE4_RHIMU